MHARGATVRGKRRAVLRRTAVGRMWTDRKPVASDHVTTDPVILAPFPAARCLPSTAQ